MFGKAVNIVMKIVETICMLLLALAVTFVTLQIFFRYFLSSPLGWTEQSSRFCFIWIVMLGIPMMFHKKAEICFDFFGEKLPGKTHVMVMVLFDILAIFFSITFFCFSMTLVMRTGNRMTSGLSIPLNALYVAQPISAVLTMLVFLKRMIDDIHN